MYTNTHTHMHTRIQGRCTADLARDTSGGPTTKGFPKAIHHGRRSHVGLSPLELTPLSTSKVPPELGYSTPTDFSFPLYKGKEEYQSVKSSLCF